MTEWIGGRRPVAEALAAGRDAHRLLVSKSARPSPELKLVLARARETSVPVETVPGDRIAYVEIGGGVAGQVGFRS